jgi:hypothetical protein
VPSVSGVVCFAMIALPAMPHSCTLTSVYQATALARLTRRLYLQSYDTSI